MHMKKLLIWAVTGAMVVSLFPLPASAAALRLSSGQEEQTEKKTLTLKSSQEDGDGGGMTLVPSSSSGVYTMERAAQATVQAMGIVPVGASSTHTVTRGEFAQMLTQASQYRDTVTGSAGLSLFSDVKYNDALSGYVKVVATNGWMSGYLDGSFRPDQPVTLEEAATALIKVLGYTTEDLVGAYPTAQINQFYALDLDGGLTLRQGDTLTYQDCTTIFYQLLAAKTKAGSIYAVDLGFTLNSDGSVNYLDVITADLEGPYVVSSASKWQQTLPFDVSDATVYFNGSRGSASDLSQYDVFYYNANNKTIWAYDYRVSGLITAISPGGLNPTSVTVAGQTYTISSSTAAYKLSTMGSYHTGDVVTLILGVNQDVVDVVASTTDRGYAYGVVTDCETITYREEDGSETTAELITLKDDVGATQQFVNTGEFYGISSGAVVIRYKGVKVTALEELSQMEIEYIGGRKDIRDENGDVYELGTNAAVFLLQNGIYSTTSLTSVSNLVGSYTVYGYYDDVMRDDGEIYVIVAVKN